jgi:hypothetical protein
MTMLLLLLLLLLLLMMMMMMMILMMMMMMHLQQSLRFLVHFDIHAPAGAMQRCNMKVGGHLAAEVVTCSRIDGGCRLQPRQ